jgi:hypothetical protein
VKGAMRDTDLASVGRQQVADTRILQRAYVSVEPQGIERSGLSIESFVLIGQVAFKNVGKLPATEFVSVVKKIEAHDAEWVTPDLSNADLPSGIAGVIPIGAKVLQGSEAITPDEVKQAEISGDKYLYVWGRAKFKDGFGSDRYVNFCHRYPWAMCKPIIPGSGVAISAQYSLIISTAISQTEAKDAARVLRYGSAGGNPILKSWSLTYPDPRPDRRPGRPSAAVSHA